MKCVICQNQVLSRLYLRAGETTLQRCDSPSLKYYRCQCMHTHSLTATVVCYYPTNVLRVVHALVRGLDDIPVAGKRWMSNEGWKHIRATNGFQRKFAPRFNSEMCVCGWVICVNHVYRCVPVPVQQQEQEVLSHEQRDVPQSHSLPACKYLCRSHAKKRCLWTCTKNERATPAAAF